MAEDDDQAQFHQANSEAKGSENKEWSEANVAPAKLFVGQIPMTYTVDDLKRLFEGYGLIIDCIVLKDRMSGMSRGCGFVTFATREAADRAIATLHGKHFLHPVKRPIQVKYAGKDEQGGEQQTDWKLFVGMLSRDTDEARLRTIFEQYGAVKEVFIMRDNNQVSKGCAFVRYESRESAVAAIAGLHEVFRDEGSPRNLTVKFAETKTDRERLMKRMPAPMANPYMGYPQYNQMYSQPNMPQNMGYGAPQQGYSGGMDPVQHGFNPYSTPYGSGQSQGGSYGRSKEQSRGPPGANIFVYNIPDSFGDGDLARLFSSFGTVLSSKVFVDKNSNTSRGFGFVSYGSPQEADLAVASMNGFEIGQKKLKVAHKKPNDGSQPPQRSFNPY